MRRNLLAPVLVLLMLGFGGFAFVLSGDLSSVGIATFAKPVLPKHYTPVPAMNPPFELRQTNWGGGSCVYASLTTNLRWQNLPKQADYVRRTRSGGAGPSDLRSVMDELHLDYASTSTGDVAFLERASDTRRGAVIFYFPNHSINFCGFYNGYAYLLDNNRTGNYLTIPKDQFIRSWQKDYGGFAFTPVYVPAPPLL